MMNLASYYGIKDTDITMGEECLTRLIDGLDVMTLSHISEDLTDGVLGYLNLELSRKALELVLKRTDHLLYELRAYKRLIRLDLMQGRPYRDTLKRALEEGILPSTGPYMNHKDRSLILEHMDRIRDFEGLYRFMMNCSIHAMRNPTDDMIVHHALAMADTGDTDERIRRICRLSLFDHPEDERNGLLEKLVRAVDSLDPDRISPDTMYDISAALENLTGEPEHGWYLRHAAAAGDIEPISIRLPTLEEDLKERYLEVYREMLSEGRADFGFPDKGLDPCDIIPPELLGHAMECFEKVYLPMFGKKDRKCASLALNIAKTCFVTGQYEKAYGYALMSGTDEACPYIYSMLADGKGVEKDPDLAGGLLDAFRKRRVGESGVPAMEWFTGRIREPL